MHVDLYHNSIRCKENWLFISIRDHWNEDFWGDEVRDMFFLWGRIGFAAIDLLEEYLFSDILELEI